eukprot:1821870-Heterocapsa_arctica.AAC.1
MRTPEVKANQTDNGTRKGAETNQQRRIISKTKSRDKYPTRSSAGNQGDRELWGGTGGKSFHDWSLELLPLMS